MAATVTLCSYGLKSQDTTLMGFLSGMMVSVTGGLGQDQLIRVNLHNRALTLYDDGVVYLHGSIAAAGNPFDRTATPTGEFNILSKEISHTSRLSGVIMPLSMRFHQGYYFHDIPLTPAGARIETKYSHGCIRLPTSIVRSVYDWAKVGAHVQIFRAELAKDSLSPTVYYLTEDGFRKPIASLEAFAARGFQWDRVVVLPYEELAVLPLGDTLY